MRCLRNQTEAKVVRTFSKNVGLPKIEADLCRYRRQHIAGSPFYANFKVKLLIFCYIFFKLRFSDERLFWQSILLSKVLRMQQDLEDEKNEATIKDLENKVKDHEATLEKKD